MILRNPASWRDSFLLRISFVALFVLASQLSTGQGISGRVVDAFSLRSVDNAYIVVTRSGQPITDAVTDSLGYYICTIPSAGRVTITVSHAGYQSSTLADLPLDGYSTLNLDHFLTPTSITLQDVLVTSPSAKNSPFVRTINTRDMILVAGHFEDPVRIAHSHPGIIQINDQANHLSARGQTPLLNGWYLEGLEIVNPNHTSNAGTFSDYPTQSGGGINMFSNQIIGKTDVYTGLNPLSIGHQAGAVIDFQLQESVRSEWRAKAGLIGFEWGGSVGRQRHSMLDFNLRYSFTGILTGLGADFGGEKIGFYDGVISYRHEGRRHRFKTFAWAGASENHFDRIEPVRERERYKDFFDIDFDSRIYGVGMRYDLSFSPGTSLRTGVAYSSARDTYRRNGVFGIDTVSVNRTGAPELLSSFVEVRRQFSPRIRAQAGIQFLNRSQGGAYLPLYNEFKFRPYIHTEWSPVKKILLEIGGELSLGGPDILRDQSQSVVPGVRTAIKFYAGPSSILYAGYVQSAGPSVIPSSSGDHQIRIRKVEGGWLWSGAQHALSFDLFYHQQWRLPVNRVWPQGVLHLADLVDPGYNIDFLILPDGEARQLGIEGQWDYAGKKGWRLTLNQTVYKSEKRYADQAYTPTRFDGRYSIHATASREIVRVRKERQRIWTFSIRGILNGGLWEESIDLEASRLAGQTIFQEPGKFGNDLSPYDRIDVSIARTIAYEKVRWRYALEIQNLMGAENAAYLYFDPFLDSTQYQNQLGLIPVFSVQAFW